MLQSADGYIKNILFIGTVNIAEDWTVQRSITMDSSRTALYITFWLASEEEGRNKWKSSII